MRRPFAPAGTPSRYTPDRPVGVNHVKLDVDLDLPGKRLSGTSTLALTARRDDLKHVELHAVEMTVTEAMVDGAPAAAFDYDGERLRIELPRARRRGDRFEVSVRYRCAPRRGLYFVHPDAAHPDRPLSCWSQGQDEDSRHYFPCVDAPIEKATSEVICTAPAGLFVLSNGELRERQDLPAGRTRWHYALDFPHAAYLMTLVCGPYAEVRDRAARSGVDVYYYAAPGREEDARRSFGRTPEMIDLFAEKIGVPYPHARYSQIAVSDFIFGGMENTTATTLTDLALLDQRAALDHDVQPLVAHELAHQWWGDLLTCRDWSEAWLNEGFATYFEYIWREHSAGRDEADVEILADTESYLSEAGKYQRPVVCRQYEEPIDLFDRHTYEKGGRVLHMLRDELGDAVFWRALRLYAERHARGSVETRDLARAVEEVSGRNLDRFFDQWVARAGHPELECAWEWDEDGKRGTFRIEQKQKISPEAPLFTFSTRLRFEVDGAERDVPIAVTERSHAFEIRLPTKPTQVIFDPGDVLLKAIKTEKSRPLWRRQLAAARLGVDRVVAARGLARFPEDESIRALEKALGGDGFWAVRAAAARALGATRRDDARGALLGALEDPHPRVRRAIAGALGDLRGDEKAAAALAKLVEGGDPSYFVEAEAAAALGRTRSPRALEVLPRILGRASWSDVIRTRAIDGLAATSDERALPVVQAEWRPGTHFSGRRAAVAGMAKLAEGTVHARATREVLETCLDDTDFRVRAEAAASLANLGDARAVSALEAAAGRELDGRAKRRMKEAVADLRDGSKPAEAARKMTDELERLRADAAKLRERVEKLEAVRTSAAPQMTAQAAARRTRTAQGTGTRASKPRRR